jgi:hypothetical protein
MNDIVLLNLRISMWGVSRVLPDHEYEVDADRTLVRATKKILECPEYEFLLQLKRSIHRRLKTLALPGEILRAGVYPVSVPMVDEVEKELEAFSIRWGVGVLALEQVWDLRVREVEDRLRALYDEEDYPSWERVRGCFLVVRNLAQSANTVNSAGGQQVSGRGVTHPSGRGTSAARHRDRPMGQSSGGARRFSWPTAGSHAGKAGTRDTAWRVCSARTGV